MALHAVLLSAPAGDPDVLAELDRVLAALSDEHFAAVETLCRIAWKHTAPERRHLLELIETTDAWSQQLDTAYRWDHDELVPQAPPLPAVACLWPGWRPKVAITAT